MDTVKIDHCALGKEDSLVLECKRKLNGSSTMFTERTICTGQAVCDEGMHHTSYARQYGAKISSPCTRAQ